jgi:hypothetical protein
MDRKNRQQIDDLRTDYALIATGIGATLFALLDLILI